MCHNSRTFCKCHKCDNSVIMGIIYSKCHNGVIIVPRFAGDGGPGLAGLGSESTIDVKAVRRFAELQRRATIRTLRTRRRAINTFDIVLPWNLPTWSWLLSPITAAADRSESATLLLLQSVQNQQHCADRSESTADRSESTKAADSSESWSTVTTLCRPFRISCRPFRINCRPFRINNSCIPFRINKIVQTAQNQLQTVQNQQHCRLLRIRINNSCRPFRINNNVQDFKLLILNGLQLS